MPTLNKLQKDQLIAREPGKSADYILDCIQKFDNLDLDDFPQMAPEKRKYIRNLLNSKPNPAEQEEWTAIMAMGSTPSRELLDALNAYIQKWGQSLPNGNHVEEARSKVQGVEAALKALQAEIEEKDWNNVDTLSIPSLLEHLHKYPHTVHRDEIDDSVWGLIEREKVLDIQNYLKHFPNGRHKAEAESMLNAFVEWEKVKNSNDIFIVHDYISYNPASPFLSEAKILLASLKQAEIAVILNDPNGYEVSRVSSFVKKGIFTDNELISSKVVTPNILEILRNPNAAADLPDIRQAIEQSYPECKEGYTDVFFFGIPSTGKTCVLMGISRSDSLRINLASGGGEYASALQQYTDVGITVPRTPGTFVTTLEATISNRNNAEAIHRLNLIEMSGEEFAFQIAGNPQHVFSFEDMGTGATNLLNNSNRKVFFLVIDPTANVVRISREVIDSYDEDTGNPITRLEYCVVNQRVVIQKMVNLFEHPANRDIMKKVDSIHIIMTKSDTLGNPLEREEKALSTFNQRFSGDILDALIDVCKEYNINSNTGFCPKLYTFSLGTFYLGGYYEYEVTDSNRLVQAIRNSTRSVKKASIWDKVKKKVN